jgi:tripartite-type tricarboxylate transporter receptor subunit TctC
MNPALDRPACRALSAAMLLPALLLSNQALAEGFYQGKTLTVIVGTDVGGGFDVYGRAVARHMHKHLPGQPNVVVQNMPGAGSMKAAEYLYGIAPRDGTVIAIVFPAALIEPVMAEAGRFRYDPSKYGYLGTADSSTWLCITFHKSKIKTFEDAQTIPSTLGGVAAGSSTVDYVHMFNALADTKFKLVSGYKSTAEIVLAIDRGEVDGVCGYDTNSLKAQKPDWYGTPLANIIVQAGLEPSETMTKMGVPSIWKYITGENRRVAELIVSQQVFGRPFVAPPAVPESQLNMLRAAFTSTMADPEFLADMQRLKLDINSKDGAEVRALIQKIYAAPKELIERMKQVLRR